MGTAAPSAIFVDQLLDLTANSEPMLVLMSIYYHDPTTKNRSLRVLLMRDWLLKKILSVVKPKNVDLFALHILTMPFTIKSPNDNCFRFISMTTIKLFVNNFLCF